MNELFAEANAQAIELQLDAIGTYIRVLAESVTRLEQELMQLRTDVNELMPAARQAAKLLEKRGSLLKLVTGGR